VYRSRSRYRELYISFQKRIELCPTQHSFIFPSIVSFIHMTNLLTDVTSNLITVRRSLGLLLLLLFSKSSSLTLDPLNFVHSGYRGSVPGVKEPECEATLSPQSLSLRTNGAIPLFLTTPSWFCMLFNDSVYFWDNCFGDKWNNVCWALVEWYWQGKVSTWRKICLIATFSATNPTWTVFCLNTGHRIKRSATKLPLLCWVVVT